MHLNLSYLKKIVEQGKLIKLYNNNVNKFFL